MQQPSGTKKYTYADYALWEGDARYELINGEAYMMAPGPSVVHQEVSGEIFAQLHNHLKGKSCKVFAAPFDVRLNPDGADDTVVQPDITIVCDPAKLQNGKNCEGVPDMVVEILSPSTARRDQLIKFNAYRAAGIREYWIVNPEDRFVEVHLLENGKYVGQAYDATETIAVNILEDCEINLNEVFPAEA